MRPATVILALLVGAGAAQASPEEQPFVRSAAALIATTTPERIAAGELSSRTFDTDDHGSVVVLSQSLDGLPVRGAGAVVRFDDRGRVAWSENHLASLADVDRTPALTLEAALARAGITSAEEHALVVYAPADGAPRLAYEVTSWRGPLARIRTWIDARSGRILSHANLVRSAERHLARVFPENPVATPGLTDVELSWIPDDADELISAGVHAQICIDDIDFTLDCKTAPVIADVDGSFLEYDYTSDADYADDFAAIQAFYHVNRARDYAAFLGLDGLDIDIKVNYAPTYATCAESEDDAAQPYENAFFDGDHSLVFGQGANADYAYDGDVAIHELGHAIMAHIGGPPVGDYDTFGENHVPRAIGEAFADYFALVLTSDPRIGDYASGQQPGWHGLEPLRDLEAQRRTCAGMVGEAHEDSLILSTALYAARQAFVGSGGDRAAFDRAVLSAQRGLSGYAGFTDVATRITNEVDTMVGNRAGTMVEHELNANGLFDCQRIIELEPGTAHRLLMLGASADEPGPLQLSLSVASAADQLDVSFAAIVSSGCLRPKTGRVSILVKKDAPILWRYDDANHPAHDADDVITAAVDGDGRVDLSLYGPIDEGTYYFQLVSDAAIAVSDLEVVPVGSPDPSGCATGDAPGGLPWLAVLAVLAARRRRRR